MAKEIAKQQSALASPMSAPDFMEQDKGMGNDLLNQKVRPSFLKIIQKQSSNEAIDQFGMGAVVLVPDQVLVLEPKASPVRVVPLFFYVEYLKLAPMALKGSEPMFKERSFDPKSDLARRCMDRALWAEDHPDHPNDPNYRYRNCEALNFLCVFQEQHLPSLPFIISFMKGNYGRGQQWCNLISMRKRALFGCVFDLSVDPAPAKNAQGFEWLRYLIANPQQMPWVADEAEYTAYKQMHLDLKAAYETNSLETSYDENEVVESAGLVGEYAAT